MYRTRVLLASTNDIRTYVQEQGLGVQPPILCSPCAHILMPLKPPDAHGDMAAGRPSPHRRAYCPPSLPRSWWLPPWGHSSMPTLLLLIHRLRFEPQTIDEPPKWPSRDTGLHTVRLQTLQITAALSPHADASCRCRKVKRVSMSALRCFCPPSPARRRRAASRFLTVRLPVADEGECSRLSSNVRLPPQLPLLSPEPAGDSRGQST